MKVKLMNSAMMPNEGLYVLKKITEEEFFSIVSDAFAEGKLESYIGYDQNVAYINDGLKSRGYAGFIKFNRANTELENGDAMLIQKLKYRVGDPKTKGAEVAPEFEYFIANYEVLI